MERPLKPPEEKAAVVASDPQQPQQQSLSELKPHHPAPAKTFQCRGYGDCRMVFSRSEHLARHIRKHTGERPFSCHCGKQFSRLDNLRQHAQTVHTDKQEQNERMMRDLTSLHTSMAATKKLSSPRHTRPSLPSYAIAVSNNAASTSLVEQEDSPLSIHQRPRFSTDHEGGSFLDFQQPSSESTRSSTHSFRDPDKSFLFPYQPQTLQLPIQRPASPLSPSPPLSASASLPQPGIVVREQALAAHQLQPTLPIQIPDPSHPSLQSSPCPSPFLRPSSASSHSPPRQAPHTHISEAAAYFNQAYSLSEVQQPQFVQEQLPHRHLSSQKSLLPKEDLEWVSVDQNHIQLYGRPSSSLLEAPSFYDPEPLSPGGHDSSPFFFTVPGVDPPPAARAVNAISPAPVNPRKRPFAGSDGPYDDSTPSRDAAHDYDYGSESRPQSHRLSVMELWNDPDVNNEPSAYFQSFLRTDSRRATPGLISTALAFAPVDRAIAPLTSQTSLATSEEAIQFVVDPAVRPLLRDVDPQIIEALRGEDRSYVLKLGQLMESLVEDIQRQRTPLLTSTDAQSSLVHQCCTYYQLKSDVDPLTEIIYIESTSGSRITYSMLKLSELVPTGTNAHSVSISTTQPQSPQTLVPLSANALVPGLKGRLVSNSGAGPLGLDENHVNHRQKVEAPEIAADSKRLVAESQDYPELQNSEPFFRGRLEEFKFLYRLGRSWPPNDLVSLLSDIAKGFTDLASLAVRYLRDPFIGDPQFQLGRLLDIFETAINDDIGELLHLYDSLCLDILSRIPLDTYDHVKLILISQVLSTGSRGKSLAVTCDALSIAQSKAYEGLRYLHPVMSIPSPQDITRKNITIYDDSFLSFLTDSTRSGDYAITEGEDNKDSKVSD